MVSESRDPTGETGTRVNFTDIRTRRLRTARYLVADVLETETEITAEAAACKGKMFQTPTLPTKTDRKLGAEDRTATKEVGRRRLNDGFWGWGNIREVSHWRP